MSVVDKFIYFTSLNICNTLRKPPVSESSFPFTDHNTNRSSRPKLFCKNMFLEISQNSHENTCATVSFLINLQASACNFIKKETLAQVFSCEFCKISKNTFSCRTPTLSAFVEIKFLKYPDLQETEWNELECLW